jgi:CBS domain-containing protein/uncharacterized membrane protein
MTAGAECVNEDETLVDAARKLQRLDVGALPICGNDDRLKGVLTDRDIVIKAIALGKDVATTLVGSLAQGKPVTIGADDSIDEAVSTMSKHEVRRLPVIDGHRLVGMVSQADIARHGTAKQAAKLVKEVSEDGPSRRGVGSTLGRLIVLALPLGGAAFAASRSRATTPGSVETSTEVAVPVSTAYNQWTQFEEFPRFMGGVEEVRQLDDTRLHWVADIGGKRREWDAKIVDQVPDQRIAWQAVTGKKNGGVVTFHPIDENRTQVKVHLDYEPEGIVERIGSALGIDSGRVKFDLERFKQLIESRGTETGGWRGTVQSGEQQ